jgi:hypothetical protein
MAMAIPFLAGAGGAVAGAGATTLTALGTAASVATGVLGTISSINEARFTEEQAAANATILEENAEKATQEAALRAQRQDFDASQELGALIAQQSASGLSGGSYALQRKTLRELAARDRGTIIFEGDAEARRLQQQAADQRTRASSARSASRFAGISGVLGVGSSLISGATKINELKRKELAI